MFHTDLLTARPHDNCRPSGYILSLRGAAAVLGGLLSLSSSGIPFCFITELSLALLARLSAVYMQTPPLALYTLSGDYQLTMPHIIHVRERGKERPHQIRITIHRRHLPTGENCLIICDCGGGWWPPPAVAPCQVNKLWVARQTGNGSE